MLKCIAVRHRALGNEIKGGRYVTDAGVTPDKLALPPSNTGELTNLKVIKKFKAIEGIVAPHPLWGPGGGVQYYLPNSVSELIEQGFLMII